MPYHPDLKFLFIHIPKAAGGSIEQALGMRVRTPDRLLGVSGRGHMLQHLTLREVTELGYLPEEVVAGALSASFVRNPWGRAVSEFFHGHKNTLYPDFPTFVRDFYSQPAENHARFNEPAHGLIAHQRSQAEFVVDATGQVAVDFLGRFETLQDDFADLCAKLGVAAPELPHVHQDAVKAGLHYSRYYDTATVDYVGELFARDVELFGYRFEEA